MSERDTDERLKQIGAAVVAIAERQDVLAAVARMETRVTDGMRDVKQELAKMQEAVHGIGDGKTGLAARVTKLEDSTAAKASIIVAVVAALAAIGGAIIATRAAAPPAERSKPAAAVHAD